MIVALAGGAWLLPIVSASADAPSDGRAIFHDAVNITTCAGASFSGDTILGSGGNGQANGSVTADAFFSVTISAYTGANAGDDSQQINVTKLGSGVVLDAVVVKGGNGYNQYAGAVSNMISPLNNGGNVPQISHWFLCYKAAASAVGSLQVTKTVVPFTGTGTPLSPIPTTFTAHVVCTDGTNTSVAFAVGSPGTVTGIVAGSNCVVTETTVLPTGSAAPVYNPATASTTGVTVAADTQVTVAITNNFSGVRVAAEEVAAAPVTVNPAFTG